MSAPEARGTLAATGQIKRWQAPPVGVASESKSEPAPRPEPLLTAEKLAAIEEQARAEGYKAGFDEGRQAGFEAGREEMRAAAARLEAIVDALTPQLRVLDEALLLELATLVLAVARQFVRRELKSQHGEVVRVVREALRALPSADSCVRVHLHPDDVALVRDALVPEALERPLKLVEDVTMTRGGARLETDSSVVDASVETRMGAIAARILGGERRETGGFEAPR
nr:flagellar assembly protein FliH [Gammaproteobacteria bacterium]